ncbi:hypothetical protein [Streptomyces avermitilis]|uniref:hypothetical protein n=1 Tax=Streptomyces avermitilis TaxID=33903 RepID=UPI0036847C37
MLLFVGGAVITRRRRGEEPAIAGDLVCLALAAFVACMFVGPLRSRVLHRLTTQLRAHRLPKTPGLIPV